MSAAKKPYVIVYYDAVDDLAEHPRSPLAAWVELKAIADGVWPMSAPIPRWCTGKILDRLGSRIEIQGDRYRVPELDAEREKRSGEAAHAARIRWQGKRDADRNAGGNADRNAGGNAETHAPHLISSQLNSEERSPRSSGSKIPRRSGGSTRGANAPGSNGRDRGDLGQIVKSERERSRERDQQRIQELRAKRDDPETSDLLRSTIDSEIRRLEGAR